MAIVLGCGHQGTEQYIGLAFRRRSERSRRCTGGGCRTTIFFLLPLPVGLVGHYPKRGQAADLEQAAAAPTAQQQTQGATGQRSTAEITQAHALATVIARLHYPNLIEARLLGLQQVIAKGWRTHRTIQSKKRVMLRWDQRE